MLVGQPEQGNAKLPIGVALAEECIGPHAQFGIDRLVRVVTEPEVHEHTHHDEHARQRHSKRGREPYADRSVHG